MGIKELLKRRDKITEAYADVFDSPQGEIVLAHMSKHAFVFTPTFTGDPYEMAMNEGSRRVVLSIFKMLNTDLGKLRTMMEEIQDV